MHDAEAVLVLGAGIEADLGLVVLPAQQLETQQLDEGDVNGEFHVRFR